MVTISHIIKKLLQNNPFLLEGLSKGIISNGNLADELKPKIEKELGKKVKEPAIIMALRRYSNELEKMNFTGKKFDFSGEIMMKTNICDFNVAKTPSLLTKIRFLYKMVDLSRGDSLNVIIGNNEVSIAISQKYKEKLKKILQGEKILSKEFNLVAITALLSKEFIHSPGIIFQVVKKLAWENINILEIISTLTELTFIISKDDSMKAYEVLNELIKS